MILARYILSVSSCVSLCRFAALPLLIASTGVAAAQTSAPATGAGGRDTLIIRADGTLGTAAAQQGTSTQSAPAATTTTPVAPHTITMMDVWLRCTGDSVNVRSKPDISSMVLTQVNRDNVLRAMGREGEWYRIVPPRGSYSVVSDDFVEMQGESRGIVSVSTTLKVRAGGPEVTVDPLLRETQLELERGAVVEVLGRENEDWLRIVPPGGVFYYVHGDFAQQISEDEARRLAETVPQPDYVDTPLVVSAATTQVATSGAATPAQRLYDVVNRIYAETKKPANEQNIAPIVADLRPLAAQTEDPTVASDALMWIRKLEESAAHTPAAGAGDASQASGGAAAATRPGAVTSAPETASEAAGPPKPFDARGVMKPTYALPAGEYGLRYKLEDPVTQKVVAYIEIPIEAKVDLRASLNRYVGVRGESYLEPKHEVTIIRVSNLTVLTLQAPAPVERPGRP